MNIRSSLLWFCAIGSCCLGLPPVLYSAHPKAAYPHKLAVSTIFKDESAWLKEWIEYHKLVGVDYFLLFDNESQDNYMEVLAPYIEEGLVSVRSWPNRQRPGGARFSWVYQTQLPALNTAIDELNGVAEWVAAIDVDEFLVPVRHPSMPALLDEISTRDPSVGCVCLNWVRYGHSHKYDLATGELLIEELRYHAPANPTHAVVKSIVRPGRVYPFQYSPHAARMRFGFKRVLANGAPCKRAADQDYSCGLINHYEIRTQSYFEHVKKKKKFLMDGFHYDLSSWELFAEHLNSIYEPNGPILRWADALREAMWPPSEGEQGLSSQ